jgi:uncharacterized ubiquitin-like protein YukD
MDDRAVITVRRKNMDMDMDIPLDVTVIEFIESLNHIFSLGLENESTSKWFVKSENPTALLKGERTLREFNVRNGSVIRF